MDDEGQLYEDYTECLQSGVGTSYGGRYGKHKKFAQDMNRSDSTVHVDVENIQMYGICSGFKGDGGRIAASYVMNRLAYEVYSDQPINRRMNSEQVVEALRRKFMTAENRFNNAMEQHLTDRFLQKEQGGVDSEKFKELTEKIRGGCSALAVIRIDKDLYVMNCGTSQAIVITSDRSTSTLRLNEYVHDNENPEEIERLRSINVDPEAVHRPTRAIGDYMRSRHYDELPEFKGATSAPVIAEPDVIHVMIQPSWKYIVLISDGVCQNLRDSEVEDIPLEIYDKLMEDNTPTSTAQNLVDGFGRKHLEAYSKHVQEDNEASASNRKEEMSLIYIKLPRDDTNGSYYSNTNTVSSTNSTMDSIIVEAGPYVPYIDIVEKPNSKLAKALEHLLLPLDTKL